MMNVHNSHALVVCFTIQVTGDLECCSHAMTISEHGGK